MNQDDIIISRIQDKMRQAEEGYYVTSTGFLDLHSQSLAKKAVRGASVNAFFYGGYEDAERRMLICAPKDLAPTLEDALMMDEFVKVVHIDVKEGGRKLTHRDFLGSVLGLGLDRSVVGDILVHENGADMIIRPDIADFILAEYTSVGRSYAMLSLGEIDELVVPEKRVQLIRDTIPSMRLDNVVSTAFKVSRSDAVRAIKSGLVYVDHAETDKIDKKIEEGSVVILRGRGKAYFKAIGGESKKGRIWVEFERYI